MAPATIEARPLARLQRLLLRHTRQLAVLSLLLACCGTWAASQLARRVRVDENALLAGHAASTYAEDSQRVAWEAKRRLEVGGDVQALEAARDTVRALRFDVMVHRPRAEEEERCTCLAAVARAPGGDGKECVVLVSPVGGKNEQERKNNAMAFGAAAGVMHHLRTQAWLAKDVLWAMPDASCGAQNALRRWLEAYHAPGTHPSEGEPEEEARMPRNGLMTAALVLRGSNAAQLKVDALGPNGALPNLDLVAAVQTLAGQHGLQVAPWSATLPAQHLLSFMWKQASGIPTGLHGEFRRFYVDAVTIEGGGTKQSSYATVVALTVRSLSNIGEKFHHSTFLYAFTAPDMMITIRDYVALVVLVLISLVFQASYLLEKVQGSDEALQDKREEEKDQTGPASSGDVNNSGTAMGEAAGEVLRSGSLISSGLATVHRREKHDHAVVKETPAVTNQNKPLDWTLPVFSTIAFHAWGLGLGGVVLCVAHVEANSVLTLLVLLCYLVVSMKCAIIPLAKANMKLGSVKTLQIASYYSTAAWFAGLAALNWALMYFSGLLFFPICICASPLKSSSRLKNSLLLLLWVVTSPLMVLIVLGIFLGDPPHVVLCDWGDAFLRYRVLSYVAGFGVFLPLFAVNTVVLFQQQNCR